MLGARGLSISRLGDALLLTLPMIAPSPTSWWLRARPTGLALVALGLGLTWFDGPVAHAQRVVPKIGNLCPMGYVDMLNGKCSTLGLMRYTVQPTDGQPCPAGWMNVGGGYCRKK
jgi:hypothetical protein